MTSGGSAEGRVLSEARSRGGMRSGKRFSRRHRGTEEWVWGDWRGWHENVGGSCDFGIASVDGRNRIFVVWFCDPVDIKRIFHQLKLIAKTARFVIHSKPDAIGISE
jgi:hypothetical protein